MWNTQLRRPSFALFQITRRNGIKFDVIAFLHGRNNFAGANIGSTEDSPAYFVHDVAPLVSETYISEFLQ